MARFLTRNIASKPSLGEILLAQRQERAVSLHQAARETNVTTRYLEALEQGDYAQLPGAVYAKSFLKVYARYLGLEADPLLQAYCSEQKINQTAGPQAQLDSSKPVERVLWSTLVVTPKIIRQALGGFVVVMILIYLGGKVGAIIEPPSLVVSNPVDNLVTSSTVIEISGEAEREAVVKINGQEVLTDQQGKFIETFVLQAGANVIEVTAEKKHSKQAKVFRTVMVLEEG